jgi:hypothetical protein
LFFVQILVTLTLVFSCSSWLEASWKIPLIGLSSLLGALPTFGPMVQSLLHSAAAPQFPPFDRVDFVIHERSISIFPFPADQMMLPWGAISQSRQMNLAIAGLILILGWVAIAYWQRHRSGSARQWLIAALLLISLPFTYLVTIFSALDLILATAAYWLVRLIRRDEDQLDLYALAILVCATFYAFCGSALLGWLWRTFELWSLTSFYSEQARMARFVYLPLFLFMGRWLVFLLYRSQHRVLGAIVTAGLVAGLVVRHWHFRDAWGAAEWGMGASLLLLAAAGIYSCFAGNWPDWLRPIGCGLGIGATAYLWVYILGWPYPGLAAAVVGGIGALIYSSQRLSLGQWQLAAGLAVIIALGWLFAQGKVVIYNDRPLRVQAYKALGLYQYPSPDQEERDAQAMYDWIKLNTPHQALFYYNDRQLEFRTQAQRAVTHSWKDLGGAYYTPLLLVDYYDRFEKLESAYQSPVTLLACALAYQADYVVTQTDQPDLPLPSVYQNVTYKVYAVEQTTDIDRAACS